MKKKIRFTLGQKIVLMLLTMSVTLCATALVVSYRTYQRRVTAFYEQLGGNVVETLATQLTAEELDRYYETSEMDDRYYEIQSFISDLVESNGVEYLYVVRPHGIGVTFLFDSDMETGENGDYASGGYCALGTYVDLEGAFAENLDKLLEGERVTPIVQNDPSYGWLMTAMTPVLRENGAMAGYVMADMSMNEMMEEQQRFLLYTGSLLAALTLGFTLVYLLLIRRSFVQPIQQLTRAAQGYEGGENKKAFSEVEIRGSDELRTLADAFRMMLVEIDLNNAEQKDLAVREQRLESELQLANELNASMLPKALTKREGGYPFAVQGCIRKGREMSCCFYDYFLLDRDHLCVLVGEVPGSGVHQILYTAMAQATIKSQMRSGLPLKEAMTAANRQLNEMSDSLALNALVGVLDGVRGTFAYVNAGQQSPLLMRSQDRYQWLRSDAYAPLGQSENVIYPVTELELHQGDRLFFHTAGLDKIQNGEGRAFGKERLVVALNESRSCQDDMERQLEYISSAGDAYADQTGEAGGYALLTLEYRRRDRAQAHCLLTADNAGSARLTEFLRCQLEANRLQPRQMAETLVLADELFALCRRQAAPDSRIMAECAIPGGEGRVILRLRGDMGGHSPLERQEGEAAVHAAEFITKNCDRVLFERDDNLDTVTVVKGLDGFQAAEGARK